MIGFGIAQSRKRSVVRGSAAVGGASHFVAAGTNIPNAWQSRTVHTIPAFRLIPSGSLFIETVKRFSETLCCDEHPAEARGCGVLI
jgi:hypothetical protein